MEKCKYYNIKQINHDPEPYYDDNFQLRYKYRYIENIAICNGTKECDPCACGGDIERCDFYKKQRKVKRTMNTVEMIADSLKNTESTYLSESKFSGGLWYNSHKGFHYSDGVIVKQVNYLNEIMNLEDWFEYKVSIMTKEEAEKKFNIKIVG